MFCPVSPGDIFQTIFCGICHNPAFIEYVPPKFLIFQNILQIDGMDFGPGRA
jgi:hypothetical protein